VSLWVLITLACVTLFNAGCAVVCSRSVFVSLRTKKRVRDLETTTADLESSFDSLLESHKRLRSRTGMRELRARDDDKPVETKADARRRIFGTAAGPAFAAKQVALESDNGNRKVRSA